MSGLAKISYSMPAKQEKNTTLSAFYISDPKPEEKKGMYEIVSAIAGGNERRLVEQIEAEKRRGAMEIFMTHPLTAKRLDALLKIKKEIGA